LHWEELEDRGTKPQRWTVSSVPARLEQGGDPWARIGSGAVSLTRARKLLRQALQER
jgi:DNA primase